MPCTPGTTPVTQLSVGVFEYFSKGAWSAGGTTTLFDTDTDAGLQIDLTMTSATSYRLVMLPVDDFSIAYTTQGSLAHPEDRVDWIEFQFFNTDSDFHPLITDPQPTDFYIRSLEITVVPEPGAPLLLAVGAALLLGRHRAIARTTRSYG